ncbi:MAG TPA: heavy metal translocating P-type ATPase, partial [Actinomycetes bacterium]|nr:heavy metal translocating P-type ATPase [Actinomycetes bacterium]
GGDDPTAPMHRAHAEITRLTRLLGGLLDELGPAGPEPEDLADLRRILYGLHAILRLHFAQEEEAYLSLLTEPGRASDPGRPPRGGPVGPSRVGRPSLGRPTAEL